MKYISYLNILAVAVLLVVGACSSPQNSPTSTSGSGGSAAVTLGAIEISAGVYRYAIGGTALSQPITITHGQSILWDSSNDNIHPLYLDNGSTCVIDGSLSFPLNQAFPTAGTYDFHCSNHSGCSTTCPATSCTGMAGTIVVQ
jgi:hypothetical protein